MSVIGANIKKIRGIKGLNQQQFADLFQITRASVGAYEEGRADPKIKTAIQIADYFGISLDLFLKKELTVNDLFKVAKIQSSLQLSDSNNLIPSGQYDAYISVPLVKKSNFSHYSELRTEGCDLASLDSVCLTMMTGYIYRAFELVDNSMCGEKLRCSEGDILICSNLSVDKLTKFDEGKIFIFEENSSYYLRRIAELNAESLTLVADVDYKPSKIVITNDLIGIWSPVRVITKNVSIL